MPEIRKRCPCHHKRIHAVVFWNPAQITLRVPVNELHVKAVDIVSRQNIFSGIFDLINQKIAVKEIREIDQSINRYKGNEWSNKSDIFHGRDIFAYCGARLASGVITYEEVGEAYPSAEMTPFEG